MAGKFYWLYKSLVERTRIYLYRAKEQLKENKVLYEIWKISFWTLIFLIALTLFAWLIDYLIPVLDNEVSKSFLGPHFESLNVHSPAVDTIVEFLKIEVAAVSVLLGLIFALYVMSFQTSFSKFSANVGEYINKERISGYFFQLLIITVLFSLITWAKIISYGNTQIPWGSLIISMFLLASSFLGIIIVKKHYLIAVTPNGLFSQLAKEIRGMLNVITGPKYIKKSWSIHTNLRIQTKRNLEIGDSLVMDLLRLDRTHEACLGIGYASEVLRFYSTKKRFIESNLGWYPTEFILDSSSSDFGTLPIKINYESQGLGGLPVQNRDEGWFEKSTVSLMDKARDRAIENTELIPYLIAGQLSVLIGPKPGITNARQNENPGAFQVQEMAIFNLVLEDFIELWQTCLSQEKSVLNYLEAAGRIAIIVCGGYDLQFLDEKSLSEIHNGKMADLPKLFSEAIQESKEKLSNEIFLEGHQITQEATIIADLVRENARIEWEIIDEILEKLFNHLHAIKQSLIDAQLSRGLASALKIESTIVTNLLNAERHELATKFSALASENFANDVTSCNPRDVNGIELLDQWEYCVFQSLISRQLEAFRDSCKCLNLTSVVLRGLVSENPSPTERALLNRLSRLPAIVGGLAFVISELDQNQEYVITHTRILGFQFRPEMLMPLTELSIQLGRNAFFAFSESTRYGRWFLSVAQEIQALPVEARIRPGVPIPMEEFNHPSLFIRRLAMFGLVGLMIMNRAEEGYHEWLKRAEAGRLVNVLKIALELKSGG